MSLILSFDQKITLFLKNIIPHSPFFNHLFSFFSLKGSSVLIWILVIIFALIFEEKKNPGISKNDKKFIMVFTLSFLTSALFVELPLKNLFHRPRPINSNQLKPLPTNFNHFQLILTNSNCPSNFSFPSNHAATSFAAATVLSFFDKKKKWFYYLTATTIAYSRIFLGCHYFLDVLLGGVIGLIMAKIIIKTIRIN